MKRDEKQHKAPGKSHREGISLLMLAKMFPDEKTSVNWFEKLRWPDAAPGQKSNDRPCPRCGSCGTHVVKSGKPMPYRCRDCRKYFSVRVGTAIESSNLPMQKWAYGTYLWITSLKGVSAMKLHRDLEVSYPTAWFMAHRLREAFASQGGEFAGPVEADETFLGGKRRNMSKAKRAELEGRGAKGKAIVAGAKDRETNHVAAQVVPNTKSETLSRFIMEHVNPGAKIYTDDYPAYARLENHESVRHSIQEFVNADVHTNGVESFWSLLKRAHIGTFHKLSKKHLQRYIDEFVGRHNIRELDTLDQMRYVAMALVGKRLKWKELIA